MIAANRTRHPLDARTLARLAAQYAGRGVVGFGLSNDERRGRTADFAGAFRDRRARRAAAGPARRRAARARPRPHLPRRGSAPSGSGTACAAPRTPTCSTASSRRGVALEVCPVSNVAARASTPTSPRCRCPQLLEAGATVALGADDPLLFGSRLAGQYATMRAAHDLDDATLAGLARMSLRASRAPSDVLEAARRDIDRLARLRLAPTAELRARSRR